MSHEGVIFSRKNEEVDMKIFKALLVFILFFCLFQMNSLSEAAVLDSSSKSSTGSSALSSSSESKASSAPTASVSKPASTVLDGINSNQPLSPGTEIYRKTEMELESSESNDYIKTVTDLTIYTYIRFENNEIKILQENNHVIDILDFTSSPEPKTEEKVKVKHLSIPIDREKQASLETIDGKELVITIVDEDNRITVREY